MFTRHISRQLAAYIDGELTPRKAQRAELHLGQCGQCRAECEQVRFGMAMVEHLPPAEAPEAIWASIEVALEVSRPVRQWRWAFAAALVLALAGVAYWRTAHPSGPQWEVVRLDGSTAVIGPGECFQAIGDHRVRLAPPGCIRARVDNQPVQPCRELRFPAKLADTCHQLQKYLLRDVAGCGLISMKKVERDGIHTVLIYVVERTEGVPIARTARFDDLCADLAITQVNHQPLRRNIEDSSSIFSVFNLAHR